MRSTINIVVSALDIEIAKHETYNLYYHKTMALKAARVAMYALLRYY